ncbi:MAG: hypothetical protein JEZ04_20340 [Spirochaetales bacterium]|nr:hypothetical protein [Spirochaetales bacterium]
MLKNLIKGIAACALIISFAACDQNPPAPEAYPGEPTTKTAVAFETLTSVFDLSGKTTEKVTYYYDKDDPSLTCDVAGYKMELFLSKTTVNAKVDPSETTTDFRSMFNYNIVASDSYSFLDKEKLLDLTQMLTGHYLDTFDTPSKTGNDPRSYFQSTDIVKGYDIKDAKDIALYRAVKITNGETSFNFPTDSLVAADLPWVKIKNGEETPLTNKAVAIESILYTFFTAQTDKDRKDALYTVKCADYAADDEYSFEVLTYDQLKTAYFMPATKTFAADSEYEDLLVVMNKTAADGKTPANDDSALRLKMPVEIVVIWP